MNATSFTDFKRNMSGHRARSQSDHTRPHLAVQIIAVIMLGVVSIVAVSMAFDATWVAGIAVLAILFPLWMKSPAFTGHAGPRHARPDVEDVAPSMPAIKPTGNASFDAYRNDMLARLEQESREFEDFLTRLRDARDSQEFDHYMNDRVAKAKDATPLEDRDTPVTGY